MVSWLVQAFLPVTIFLWMLTPSDSSVCDGRRGSPGIPGIPGAHGENGKDGLTGEKGDPGEDTQPVKGEKGDQGTPGRPGRPGLMGDKGEPGLKGPKGVKGPKGAAQEISVDKRSFFSYKKSASERNYIQMNRIVDFDSSLSSENNDALNKGLFKAKLAGLYYFVYHVSAAQATCLCIKHQKETVVNLCDSSQGILVTSGSVVLDLQKDETVGVYACYKHSNIISKDAESTFTGFLLFPS